MTLLQRWFQSVFFYNIFFGLYLLVILYIFMNIYFFYSTDHSMSKYFFNEINEIILQLHLYIFFTLLTCINMCIIQ